MAAKKKITVIGLARFGEEICRELTEAGAEVTALDSDRAVVEKLRDRVARVGIIDGTDREALREFEVQLSDHVVIGIRDRLEVSILILLALADLGVKNVTALAASDQADRALQLIGHSLKGIALRVVFPETDIAERQAQMILNPSLSTYIELAEGYSLVETPAPKPFLGKSLLQLDARNRFGVLVVAARNRTEANSRPYPLPPDRLIDDKLALLMIGPNERIRELTRD
jgi:trk system potassium uptake protein TrkA